VDAGARDYFATRHANVAPFVAKHFSLKGALRLNRLGIGGDLWRAPVNLMWATPFLLARCSAPLLRRIGLPGWGRRLAGLPGGCRTRVQNEVEWLLYTELLEIPFAQSGRRFEQDGLLANMLARPELSGRLIELLGQIEQHSRRHGFNEALLTELEKLGDTRIAAADLACGVLSLSAGVGLFSKLTPGALSTGSALAAAIAQQSAIANFAFGSTLGSLYYGMVPVTASAGLVLASTGGVLVALGMASALSGMVTDPIQARTGLHARRLHRFIDALEEHFAQGDSRGFRPKDRYLARVFDLFDLLKTAAGVIK
jgi:hypothetical protein